MYLQDTPKPSNEQEAVNAASGRDAIYIKQGFSKSTIDHFFDKLIHISLPEEMKNEFIQQFYLKKKKQMIDYVIRHAKTNY